MQYFSTGLALSLSGLRFRVRIELDDDPEELSAQQPPYLIKNEEGCEACRYDHFASRTV